jgi:hypothetical protein
LVLLDHRDCRCRSSSPKSTSHTDFSGHHVTVQHHPPDQLTTTRPNSTKERDYPTSAKPFKNSAQSPICFVFPLWTACIHCVGSVAILDFPRCLNRIARFSALPLRRKKVPCTLAHGYSHRPLHLLVSWANRKVWSYVPTRIIPWP